MSATTSERRESTGFVAETLRRPIQEAVKEGVKEAIREDEEIRVRGSERGTEGEDGDESGGGGRGPFGLLLLLGVGVAAALLWRRRRGGSNGGTTESIRERSKTDESGIDVEEPGSGAGTIETAGGGLETEDAPEPSGE